VIDAVSAKKSNGYSFLAEEGRLAELIKRR